MWTMPRPEALSEVDKARVVALRARKLTYGQIADRMQCSLSTVARYCRGHDGASRLAGMPAELYQSGSKAAIERWADQNPRPKAYHELSDRAKRALKDFPYFCDEILGEPLHAHQVRWHNEELEAQRAGNLFNMLNCHPRSGKTDSDNKWCLWVFAGGGHPINWYDQMDPPLRDTRVMLVAGAETQSDKNFEYIQVRLSEHKRLIGEYGRFKENGSVWRPSAGVLTIAGRRKLFLSGDYSLVCVGTLSHVLGRGADHIKADDPFDAENTKTPEQAERGLRWIRASIFSRLEPGGTVSVRGARLPVASEPYTAMSRWPGDLAWDSENEEPPDEEAEDYPRLFHTVVEPAVLDWDRKVVLVPERFTWAQLMKARRLAGPEVWEASWMQNPQATDASLARREWIYGAAGVDPYSKLPRVFPGCVDVDRSFGQEVLYPTMPTIRVVSVDPSDIKWWGIHCLDLHKGMEGFCPTLIDLDRNKHTTSSFLALLEAWWDSYHFRVIVLERNMAKFLLENEAFISFCRRRGVKVITHHTADNKNHPRWGIGTLRDDFKEGRIRIPGGDTETRWKFNYFIKEALGEMVTDDTLLALWFVKFNLNGLLAMADAESQWQGWGTRATRHPEPPARIAKRFAGVGGR